MSDVDEPDRETLPGPVGSGLEVSWVPGGLVRISSYAEREPYHIDLATSEAEWLISTLGAALVRKAASGR